MPQPPDRTIVRSVRSARRVPLRHAATAAGVELEATLAALQATTPRGRCDTITATTAASNNAQERLLVAGLPLLSPPRRDALAAANRGTSARHVAAADGRRGTLPQRCPHITSGYGRGCADPALLAHLGGHPDARIREAAAGNVSCPPAVLVALSADPDQRVRLSAATNPGAWPRMLTRLANDPDVEVSAEALTHPGCPPTLLQTAVSTGDTNLREALATTSKATPALLEHMAADPEPPVRSCAAANPSARPQTLARLSADPRRLVRELVMTNPSTAAETLICSFSDPDEEVAAAAVNALASRTNADTSPVATDAAASGEELWRTASDPDTPIADVALHMGVLNPAVRAAAAENMARRCRNHMFIP